MMERQQVIDTAEKYYLPVFGRQQLVLDHGRGAHVWDKNGREYIDFLAGIAVNSLGYAHPAQVQAITEQAGKLMHCSNIFYTEIQAKATELVCQVSGMDRVFFANSGAEANEGALKLARKYGTGKSPDKFRIITAKMSFHGRTMATLTATGQPHYQEGYAPLPGGYEYVPYGDIAALEKLMDGNVCAVLLEPIQGEGGVHVPSYDYLPKVRELCDKFDAILIFDEIQTGVGRTGAWFEYMNAGVKPDVLTFAKGIGGGFPVGGFAVPEKLARVFKPGDHGGTFGGNALAMASVYATLSTIKEEDLVAQAREKGVYFKGKLEDLALKYPEKIREVRGRGLILGVETTRPAVAILQMCLDQGVIVNVTVGNVVRLVPPLVVTKADIDKAVLALDNAFAKF